MVKFTVLCLLCSLARCCAESVSGGDTDVRCSPPEVTHGRLQLSHAVYRPGNWARLVCREGYQLDGPDRVTCGGQGRWRSAAYPDDHRLPQCRELSCAEPAELDAGRWEVEGVRTGDGSRFKHGAVALYRCEEGFQLVEERASQRVCTNGAWRGDQPVCARTGCGPPPVASQGFFLELFGDGSVTLPRRDQYPVGARVEYRCNPEHVLVGTDTYQCMRSGEWSPPVAPGCQAERPAAPPPAVACGLPERAPLTTQRLLRGWLSDDGASAGAVVEYACTEGTRDRLSPCRPQRLTCYSGRWLGRRPRCLPVAACDRPPAVPHGEAYGDGRTPGAEVFYTCEAGYRLLGPRRLTCDAGGCWSPARLAPVCKQQTETGAGPSPLLSPAAVTLLAVTAAVLLLVLLLALLLQRRAWKPLRRPPPPPPPPGPGRVEDADRVALIAYPEGSQYVLPTYEEAVRSERAAAPLSEPAAGGGLAPRLHHHRSLPPAARRERLWRREQESDSVSQRSVQSHHSVSRQSNTASNATASLLDSMGSTDTMATSDAASNTLSAAATASVRGMCGSLASFDTSSVLNTEGVPLLEENETELEGVEQEDSLSCGKSSSGDAASNK